MSITYGGFAATTSYYIMTSASTENVTYEATSTAGWVTGGNVSYYTYPATTYITDQTFVGTGYVSNIGSFGVGAYPETEEQRLAREKSEKELAERTRKADRRARMLFCKVAGKKAYQLLKKNGHYDVVGVSGQRYRLAIGMKVRVMEGNFGDKVLHQLCAYIPDVPQVDTLLAQYLALTSSVGSEEEFKKIAIKHAA